jgi:hypothetical protein
MILIMKQLQVSMLCRGQKQERVVDGGVAALLLVLRSHDIGVYKHRKRLILVVAPVEYG